MRQEAAKFEIGDIIVPLEYAGMPLSMTDIWKVSDKDSGEYGLQGIAQIGKEYYGFEFVENNYVKADDVLWYWEYQDEAGDWHMLDRRCSKDDLNMLEFRELATATPLCALGFRLPQKGQKTEQIIEKIYEGVSDERD